MSKVIKLKEGDLYKIVEELIKEQHGPGSNSRMADIGFRDINRTVTLGGSIFENGVDLIDMQSSEYQKGLDAIKSAVVPGKGLVVKVIGGASKVGEAQGYNNKSLALRRAKNFISSVKGRIPNVEFVLGEPQIGGSSVKNSPEAKAAQFVKLQFSVTNKSIYNIPARDNTSVAKIYPDMRRKPGDKYYKYCIEIPEKMNTEFLNKYSSFIVK